MEWKNYRNCKMLSRQLENMNKLCKCAFLAVEIHWLLAYDLHAYTFQLQCDRSLHRLFLSQLCIHDSNVGTLKEIPARCNRLLPVFYQLFVNGFVLFLLQLPFQWYYVKSWYKLNREKYHFIQPH